MMRPLPDEGISFVKLFQASIPINKRPNKQSSSTKKALAIAKELEKYALSPYPINEKAVLRLIQDTRSTIIHLDFEKKKKQHPKSKRQNKKSPGKSKNSKRPPKHP